MVLQIHKNAQNKIFLFLFVILFSTGCQNNNQASAQSITQVIENNVISRDLSVNKSNAYNNIFFDSTEMEKFILKENLDSAMSIAIRSFYNARNYEYAWFAGNGFIEQAFSFRSLYSSENDTDVFNKSLEAHLDRLRIKADSIINPTDLSTIQIELQITKRFIQYALKNYVDMGINANALGTYIPARKKNIMDLADSVLKSNNVNNAYAALNESYKLLKIPLQKYCDIERNGGWPTVINNLKQYKIGTNDSAIVLLKKRLQITGELAGNDSSIIFNEELENAIKKYQLSRGYQPTGIITGSLVKDMNITVIARIQQLLINMQRMRWMPTHPNGKLIIVNIPAFEVYVDSSNNILFQMDAVVGAEGHNTTMFSGELSQVVFSPYWNIPPSIVKKEVVTGMRRSKNYLIKRNMEITGRDAGLPVVRQRPGANNALGKVKFLFPNSFNIYLHDTPEKQFFNNSQRDLSHGCIRLSDAPKLAHYLLQNSKTWTKEKIDSAMNSGHEQIVKLKDPVPVIITYYTAWVDNRGVLHFADDIYQHDREMAVKMFSNVKG